MMEFVMVAIGKWSKVVIFALEPTFPILSYFKNSLNIDDLFVLVSQFPYSFINFTVLIRKISVNQIYQDRLPLYNKIVPPQSIEVS